MILTNDYKVRGALYYRKILDCLEIDGDDSLDLIVTGNETPRTAYYISKIKSLFQQ